ncbi:MAG: hypothetical protein EOO38_18805 [Cytophagaceae bacterium]|nr:MAG: hypothetical protein EOO38_18805 [Cytophagaceae bacterium]
MATVSASSIYITSVVQVHCLLSFTYQALYTCLIYLALFQMLEGHAIFLKNKKCGDQTEELLLVERRLGGLAISIQDLRGAARNISQAA